MRLGPSRHRPALERAAELEPKVVVNPAGIVLLHDELPAVPAGSAWARRGLRFGLGGAAEIALLLVGAQRIAARRAFDFD